MTRRKATAFEKQLKVAAEELGLPKDDWQVERLATLKLMYLVARSKWSNGQVSNSSDMLALMAEITGLRKEAKLMEPMDIKVHIVESEPVVLQADIECKHCGKVGKYQVSNRPFDASESRPDNPSGRISHHGPRQRDCGAVYSCTG